MPKGGGFFNNFAFGASQTFKTHFDNVDKATAQANAQADANIREKIASVDPAAALYQRQKDIDLANHIAEKTADDQRGMDAYAKIFNDKNTGAAVDSTNPGVAPTITSPGVGGNPLSMAPTSGTTSTDLSSMSPDDHYNEMNKATTGKAIAALTGNKGAEAAFDAKLKLHQNELDRSKRVKEDNKDTLTAADGINVPDYRLKKSEKDLVIGKSSMYGTGSLQSNAMDEATVNQELSAASDIHVPLIASYMTNNPGTKEVASVIDKKTLPAAQSILTLSSDKTTPEEKHAAAAVLTKYLKTTYAKTTADQLTKDANFHSVLTPDLVDRYTAALENSKAATVIQATAPSAPAVTTPTAAPVNLPGASDQAAPASNVVGTWNPATGKVE